MAPMAQRSQRLQWPNGFNGLNGRSQLSNDLNGLTASMVGQPVGLLVYPPQRLPALNGSQSNAPPA